MLNESVGCETSVLNKRKALITSALIGAVFGAFLLLPIAVPVFRFVESETVFSVYFLYLFGVHGVLGRIFGEAMDSSSWGPCIFIVAHALLFFIERLVTLRFERRKVLIVYVWIIGLFAALVVVFSSWLTSIANSRLN